MNILKIIAYPTYFLLSLLTAILTFLTCIATGICTMLSGLCVFCAIILFLPILGYSHVGYGVGWLIAAFLFSEFGLPAVAGWLLSKIYIVKFALKDFIDN